MSSVSSQELLQALRRASWQPHAAEVDSGMAPAHEAPSSLHVPAALAPPSALSRPPVLGAAPTPAPRRLARCLCRARKTWRRCGSRLDQEAAAVRSQTSTLFASESNTTMVSFEMDTAFP